MRWSLCVAETGPEAMAHDLALLELGSGTAGRSHGWSQPTLTYGRGQLLPARLIDDAERAGVDLVRRPTGGGWLLHLPGDLAVTFARRGPLGPGAFRGAQRFVASRLAEALASVGAPAELAPAPPGPARRAAACFARVDASELVEGGEGARPGETKLAGIALARIARCVLVQSALPLVPASDGPLAAFARRWDPARAAAVRRLAPLTSERLARAVATAFGDAEDRGAGRRTGQISEASASRSDS